mmetsp:Transcript_4500/g.5579  ORF Transcript_4500/g.5579 Transcript_4500/m.5579 type:complete len:133 (-) Transcript_4500:319-717(-)
MVGVYYDDPEKTPEDKTRWAVGVMEEDLDASAKECLLKAGYKTFLLQGCKTVEAKWKFIPQLGFLSILLMVHRCYPALEKYIKTNKLHSGNAMEFYHGYKKNSFGIGFIPVDVRFALKDRNTWAVPEVLASK